MTDTTAPAARKVLHVIGYGINFDADRSVLVDPYLDQCDIVFALESDIAHLRERLKARPLVNLVGLYEHGKLRDEVYGAVAERILAAFASVSRVGLLVEGSPFFLDTICELLELGAVTAGIEVVYVDGRSSLDGIIQALRIPMGWGIGIQLADTFCSSQPVIDPNAVNIFFQPGNVGSDRVQMTAVDGRGVARLKDTLLRFYAPSDRWLLVNLGESAAKSTKIVWGTLERLDSVTALMHSGTLIVSKNWWPADLAG